MAQRTGIGSGMLHHPVQTEECISVPAGASRMPVNRAEGTIYASIPFAPLGRDLHHDGVAAVVACEGFTHRRNARVGSGSDLRSVCCIDLTADLQGGLQSKVGIPDQLR